MGGVSYDEEDAGFAPQQVAKTQDLAEKLVRWGVAPNEKVAQYAIIGFLIASLFIIAYFLISGTRSSGNAYGNLNQVRAAHPELFTANAP